MRIKQTLKAATPVLAAAALVTAMYEAASSAGPSAVQAPEARAAIRQNGARFGRLACAEAQVKEALEIKPKAWGKIQSSCIGLMVKLGDLPEADGSLAYSLCIGAALEECQDFIGVASPCRDLASCREQLGVP